MDKEQKISFSMEVDNSLANAIRRSVSEIDILAIDEAEIHKNDSALPDEVIAHRLGLIPLEQKPAPKAGTIQLKIKSKGPGTVYSGELKDVIFDKMPLVILEKDQELELVVDARYGKGVDHTKFNPGFIYYKNLAKIEIDKGCDSCKECIEACPNAVLKEKDGKMIIDDLENCDLCEACVEACKKQGKDCIKVGQDKKIVFSIESFGQLPAKKIVIEACSALKSNLAELNKKL